MISKVQMDLTVNLNVKYTQNGSAIKFENVLTFIYIQDWKQ